MECHEGRKVKTKRRERARKSVYNEKTMRVQEMREKKKSTTKRMTRERR